MKEFNLADFIKERRSILNLTTRELAEKVGVSAPTISKWEKGQIAHIKEDKITLLATALNVSPLVLFGYKKTEEITSYTDDTTKLPVFDVHCKDDFFNVSNVIKILFNTNKKADFAIIAPSDVFDIRKNDVILMQKVSTLNTIENGKYILVKPNNSNAILAQTANINDSICINFNGNIITIDKQEEILGIAVEVRRVL